MRRIGFDARLIGAMGIGRYISGLLPHLGEILGPRLTLIVTAREAAGVRAQVGRAPSLLVVNAPPYRLAEQLGLPLKLLGARLDLIHFTHYNLPLLYFKPFVVTVHDLFSFQFPEIHSGPLPRLVNQLLIRNAVKRSRALITPSTATRDAVSLAFPGSEGKLLPIPEAVDDRFHPQRDPAAEAAWQRRFGVTPPYLLYLGQWKSYKNLPLLFQAFSQVHQQRPSSQLVVLGDDPRHPEVRQMASTLPPGAAVLPGRVPDASIPDLYRGAAALVLPSRAEGFGLPVLEAMACGVRVVCSDLPVLREVSDGAAIFCDPNDAGSFARGMLEALDTPLGPEWRQQAVKQAQSFSWRQAAERTVAVYERAIAG